MKGYRDELPATGPQLHLIAVLTLSMKMKEPVIKTQGEAGLYIQELYRERESRKKRRCLTN